MEFCECGALMLPTSTGKLLVCPICGKRSKSESGAVVKEKIEHEKAKTKKRASQEIVDTLPMVDSDCAKCGNKFAFWWRSEEHTSELQSHVNLVCRLLLEK